MNSPSEKRRRRNNTHEESDERAKFIENSNERMTPNVGIFLVEMVCNREDTYCLVSVASQLAVLNPRAPHVTIGHNSTQHLRSGASLALLTPPRLCFFS